MLRLISATVLVALPAPALAQADWSDAAGGTPTARVEAAIAAQATALGAAQAMGDPPRSTGGRLAITMATVTFARDPANAHLFIATGPVAGVCHQRLRRAGFTRATLENAAADCLRGFTARAKAGGSAVAGGAPGAAGPPQAAGDAAVPAAASAPPRFPGNWNQVSAVLFTATQMIGVGGIPYPDFEPLILFKDGRTMQAPDAALEDIDLAADAAKRPRRWGRWQTAPGGYTLTSASGRTETRKLQDGALFKAFPGQANGLEGNYRRISGGGNSGLGGEMTIAASSQYLFAPDGRFTRESSFGAIGSGSTSGVGMAASSRRRPAGTGHYTLSRHTLTLTHPDGRTRRHFFAIGSEGNPARPDSDMIFIDDSVFPRRRD